MKDQQGWSRVAYRDSASTSEEEYLVAQFLRAITPGCRWWRVIVTLTTLAAIVASACAPAAPPPAPTAAPSQPTAAAKPATAPAAPTTAPAAPTTAPAAAATTAPAAAPAAKPGEVLKVVLGAEALTLEPSIDNTKTSLVIDGTILETLAMNTPQQTFKPWLAESWEPVAPTKWRLKLRKGVKFHNGEPFNADAVAYSVNIFVTTKGQARGWFMHVAGSEKVDDYTIDIVTKEPTAVLPATLALLYVFPPKYHAEVGTAGFGKKPIGTGAYKFVEWVPGVQLKVTANPDYWGKKPSITDIQFRWAPEASSRVALLETGDVHIAQNIPPAMVERVEKSGAARVEVVKSIRKVFLMINIDEGPTKDVRVRKALNYATDVEGIIKTLFKGRAFGRDKGFIIEGLEGYQGDKLEAYKYDPDMAKKLLTEAGFANGVEMPFWHPIGRYMLDKESSEAIAGQLSKVGIKVTLQGMESGAYFSRLTQQKVQGIAFFACGPVSMTPFHCGRVHWLAGADYAYGADDRTNAMLKESMATLDDAKRVKLLQDLEKYIQYDQVSWVWLWQQQDIYGASNKINWKARSDELITFDDVSFK